MNRFSKQLLTVGAGLALSLGVALFDVTMFGQNPAPAYTWQQIKERFEAVNPTLIAARANIDEARASEITASLRPNPDFSLSTDGFQLAPNLGIWRPLSGVVLTPSISYTHERQHKRELRVESAKKSTAIAESSFADIERGLLFNLRNAFVGVLQAKAVFQNATENLTYWDQELTVNQKRFDAGDMAELDLNTLQFQKSQFETDYQNAILNLKTSKIQIQQLVVDRTPIDRFDVNGAYEYAEKLMPLESFRMAALEARPDLKEAVQNVELARTNHQLAIANGSTDPTWGVWYSHNASFANTFANNTAGFSVSFPLRFFSDRNQGEKARTLVDIGRNEKLRDATEALVYGDVDSAYVTLEQALNLLGRYKTYYLPLAARLRDKRRDAFQHGGASLLDYLEAEKSYRDANLSYLNFIGSYLTAAAQMNQAVGREVLP
jgi:cobalt-zinc-cadmium efflux system outer membrane protein